MRGMDREYAGPRGTRELSIIAFGLSAAIVFELATVPETQDKAIRAVSPWRDDPYHTVVSFTQFTVPMLAVVIGLRLLVWGAPGGEDRARQMLRAVAVLVALMALSAGFEWTAVAVGMHRTPWTSRTDLLIAGLVMVSALTVALAALLTRVLRTPATGGEQRQDWLGDLVLFCARVPMLQRLVTAQRAAWVRQHAMLVFSGLSVFLGAVEISGMIFKEHWTDPLLISWAIVVLAGANLAFCVISNAISGFIARPSRRRAQRATETAAVVGSVTMLTAVAFHDEIWRLGTRHPLDSVAPLVALTFGAGVTAAAITAVIVARGPAASAQAGNRRA
jgi:hypothetical protein